MRELKNRTAVVTGVSERSVTQVFSTLDGVLDGIAELLTDAPPPDQLVVDGEARAAVERALAVATDPDGTCVVLRGPEGAGKRALVASLARAAGRPTLVVAARVLPRGPAAFGRVMDAVARSARLAGAALLVDDADTLRDADRGRAVAVAMTGCDTPWFFASTGGAVQCLPPGPRRVEITLAVPDEEARLGLWRRALGELTVDEVELRAIVAAFPVSAGLLLAAARVAVAVAGPEPLTRAHVAAALARVTVGRLDGAAHPIAVRGGLAEARLSPSATSALVELVQLARAARAADGPARPPRARLTPTANLVQVTGLVGAELDQPAYVLDVTPSLRMPTVEIERRIGRAFDVVGAAGGVLLVTGVDALAVWRDDATTSERRRVELALELLRERIGRFPSTLLLGAASPALAVTLLDGGLSID